MIDPPPARERTRCRCVLVGEDVESWCNQFTSGPDDPFCPSCEARHPERPADQVRVRPLEVSDGSGT